MGQAHSSHQQQQLNWLEFCKLTVVTVALGAVQFARYRLASADEDERRAARQRGWSHRGPQQTDHNHQSVFHALPHDVRRSLVTFIDTSITPLLIDQWRCGTDQRPPGKVEAPVFLVKAEDSADVPALLF